MSAIARELFASPDRLQRLKAPAHTISEATAEKHPTLPPIRLQKPVSPHLAAFSRNQDPEREYRAIEATLLATSRGRWFLAEHGRRARRIDGALLEDAIQRLKTSLREPTALIDQLERELTLVRGEFDAARAALTARPAVPAAGAGPDSSVQRILSAAQQMHELAWTLQGREGQDFDQSTCEQIARQAVAVYALSREQATATEHTLALLDRLSAAGARLDGLLRSLDLERKSATEG